MSYREHLIPKKGKNKFRKIVAPNSTLLNYQRNKLPFLEAWYDEIANEKQLSNIAHGFRKNKNCITGASRHKGFDLTIMLDLSDFFDNVKSYHIPIYEIQNDRNLFHADGYAAQGFATSPMIANIAVLPQLEEMNMVLEQFYPGEYALTMYADDIQISLNRRDTTQKGPEENVIIEIVYDIFENAGFPMNKKKTRIRYQQHGYRKILGVNVGQDHVRATRKVMKKIRAAGFQGNYQSKGGLTTWSRCLLPRANRPLNLDID